MVAAVLSSSPAGGDPRDPVLHVSVGREVALAPARAQEVARTDALASSGRRRSRGGTGKVWKENRGKYSENKSHEQFSSFDVKAEKNSLCIKHLRICTVVCAIFCFGIPHFSHYKTFVFWGASLDPTKTHSPVSSLPLSPLVTCSNIRG